MGIFGVLHYRKYLSYNSSSSFSDLAIYTVTILSVQGNFSLLSYHQLLHTTGSILAALHLLYQISLPMASFCFSLSILSLPWFYFGISSYWSLPYNRKSPLSIYSAIKHETKRVKGIWGFPYPLAFLFCLAKLPNSNIFIFSSASSSLYLTKRSSNLCLNISASYRFWKHQTKSSQYRMRVNPQ